MSKIRKGNPHKDQMDVEISRLSKLGGLLEAMDKPRSLAAGFWKKSRINMPLKKKNIKRK